MSDFKYMEEDEIDAQFDFGLVKNTIALEIAYQLKRIADKLRK